MSVIIQYRGSSGKKTYITQHHGYTNKHNLAEIMSFGSVKQARNFFNNQKDKDMTLFGYTRNLDKFYAVDVKTNVATKLNTAKTEANATQMQTNRYQPNNLNNFVKHISKPNHQCLILDLEFFQDQTNKSNQLIQQIAGVKLDDHQTFNFHVFSDKMSPKDQLDFLKQTNYPYQLAQEYTLTNVIYHLKEWLVANQIDTIISWDNRYDFKKLATSGYDDLFQNITSCDLSKLIASQLFENSERLVSLQGFCHALNLTNDGKWHDALADSQMIYKVCQYYLNQVIF